MIAMLMKLITFISIISICSALKRVVFVDAGNTCRSPILMTIAKKMKADGKFSNVASFESGSYEDPSEDWDDTGFTMEAHEALEAAEYAPTDHEKHKVNADWTNKANDVFYVVNTNTDTNNKQTVLDLLPRHGRGYDVKVLGIMADPWSEAAHAKSWTYPSTILRAEVLLNIYKKGNDDWDFAKDREPNEWKTEWTRDGGKTQYDADMQHLEERRTDLAKANERCRDNNQCRAGCKCVAPNCVDDDSNTTPCPHGNQGGSSIHNGGDYSRVMPHEPNFAHLSYYGDQLKHLYNDVEVQEMDEIRQLTRERYLEKARLDRLRRKYRKYRKYRRNQFYFNY